MLALLVLAGLIGIGNYAVAQAETASSSNYEVTDTQFGAGTNSGCSASYCASDTAGNLVVGSGSSANYTAEFGSKTSDNPLLEVISLGNNINFGTFSTAATATATTQFSVRAYEVGSYDVQIAGNPPSYAGHELDTPSTPTASDPGTEQFGINLVANTFPSIGSDPVQVPNSTFSFGEAASGYNTPNEFQYSDGGIIAQSDTSTGQTDYTVSMIINISNVTPAGQYTGSYSVVVVPAY